MHTCTHVHIKPKILTQLQILIAIFTIAQAANLPAWIRNRLLKWSERGGRGREMSKSAFGTPELRLEKEERVTKKKDAREAQHNKMPIVIA